MGFLWFGKKRDDDRVEKLSDNIKSSFDAVKDDFKKAADWISHLHSKDNEQSKKISDFDGRLSSIENEINEIKTFISFFSTRMSKQVFKHEQTVVDKQTVVEGVQTPVQTAIQTAFLGNLSVMERAIVWIFLNTDMKLGYEDVAAILNKDKSTIRGQLNSIKNKSDILEEVMEKNGKKRYFIPEKVREMFLSKIRAEKKRKVKSES
jgi:predicted transcriptional regulator